MRRKTGTRIPAWDGCASRTPIRIASGFSRLRSSTAHSCVQVARTPDPSHRTGVGNREDFAECRRATYGRLIVQVLPATQLIDLLDDVVLGLDGQTDRARRNATNALVAHIREPGQFPIELLVVLVVGEVRRLDTEEVGKGSHGRCGGIGAVA